MRPSLCLIFGFFFAFELFGSDSIPHYTFDDAAEIRVSFKDSLAVFYDHTNLSIHDILNQSDRSFNILTDNQMVKAPLYVWSRVQITNATKEIRNDYFLFCDKADSIWVFETRNRKVLSETVSGSAFSPMSKSPPSRNNFIPLYLNPGESKTFYIKTYFSKNITTDHTHELFVRPGQQLFLKSIEKYGIQSFYTGIMLLFSLLSFLMFSIFRERIFIYFGLVTFFFILYFLNMYGLLIELFFNHFSFQFLQQLLISGIIASFSLFIVSYIQLPKYFPNYFKLYALIALYGVLFAHVASLLGLLTTTIVTVNNYTLLIWITASIVPIFILAKRGEQQAKILLISIGILFLSSLLFVLSLLNILPVNLFTKYGIQIGTILFSGSLFYGLFSRINAIRGEKKHFEELDQLKSRFFANISHEFRTPLTLISGPVKQVMDKLEDSEDQKLLQLAHQNSGRLLQLVNQLLDLSKLETGKMQLKISKQNFALLLKGIVMSFESLAAGKNIKLHFVSESDDIPLYLDIDKVEKIFYNLLSNAFKFTKENGEVSVMVSERSHAVEILVKDRGIGIEEKRLPYIFNRFFQIDDSEIREHEGTGIGLALVKELVQIHSGKISVESVYGKGSTFKVSLPKGQEHFKAEDMMTTESQIKSGSNIALDLTNSPDFKTDENENTEAPLILIVEDNVDVRSYIKQHLLNKFRILEAVNGQDGLDKALEYIPDLVISDVMMPKKNGYEVCNALKSDIRTSHIPIILLTAKAAQEEKLKGLSIGADDYLIKPFDTRELEIRILNLIKLRRQLSQLLSQNTINKVEDASLNPIDKKFLDNVINSIEAHLADLQFSVELLANEVGMSRVHLNRKLKALTNQSANKYIQSFRLQRAMDLIQSKQANVSEIAYETGFNSTAYFVKCFREKYGKTPGSMLKE